MQGEQDVESLPGGPPGSDAESLPSNAESLPMDSQSPPSDADSLPTDSDLEMLSAAPPVPGNMDDDELPRDGKDDLPGTCCTKNCLHRVETECAAELR